MTSREEPVVTIMMASNVGLRGVKSAFDSDVNPGDYVGAAALPGENGTAGALKVLIFPSASAADGSLTTAFVVVGNQGVVPPM